MGKLLFDLTDEYGVKWAGMNLRGKPWLLCGNQSSGGLVTVRELSEQEVEQYQKLAGNYIRS